MNEYYGVPTTPGDDYLAHYGVKGMKWGVRRALSKGGARGARALARRYAKDAKHLAKLEKRAASGKKYAKRAALMGAGAAAAGGLAAGGTALVGRAVNAVGQGMSTIGYGANRVLGKHLKGKVGSAIKTANTAIGRAGQAVSGTQRSINAWGQGDSVRKGIDKIAENAGYRGPGVNIGGHNIGYTTHNFSGDMGKKVGISKEQLTNNNFARAGAAALGAGLAAGAGYNVYRALTAKKNAERADTFRKEMNKAYSGTIYGGGGKRITPKRKRRG